ncbi:ribbon-helix-helix domain-containing protein [Sphingobium mellinum]|uniref:ribbon-helix-helix domain-containing protein n=1 Tax=Sphingobium mellinum TaxID=1387166 RepID=UPI0030EDCA94
MDGGGDSEQGDVAVPACVFAAPVKRSVTIAGHQTAISLEPIFWEALRAHAERQGLPVNALIARIDAARLAANAPPNLASAVRCWLYAVAAKGKNVSQ